MSTKIFLSWAHKDEQLKDKLLESLRPHLELLPHQVEWWEDSDIRIGEQWRREILKRLHECDYVLQLISPNFLTSDFIKKYEIPPTVGNRPIKAALPAMLVNVPLDGSRNFHGIDALQIFRSCSTQSPRAFNQLSSPSAREQFACDLASKINLRLSAERSRA